MTSEISQLFTQALEMLISWSSFDCILNSRTCNFIHRTIMIKPMKTTLDHVLLKLSTQWVRNVSAQSTAIRHLQGLFILSAAGWDWSFPMGAQSGSVPLVTRRCSSRWGGSVELHKRDGRQLLAELLQHDHALQQRDVVDTAGRERAALLAHGRVRVEFLEKNPMYSADLHRAFRFQAQ